MASRDPTLCPDELLAQLGWVRALARSLVYDPHDADDVLQQVCLLALQKAPAEARTGPRLRAWLATVTREVIRRGARSDGRRTRRELAVPQAEPVPSADLLAARREALRQLVHAVADLEEPYFSVIVERYFEGRSIPEIAALHLTTAPAVRQRLTRARAQLRARLERLLNQDSNAWLLAALPMAPATSSLTTLIKRVGLGRMEGILMATSKSTAALATSVLFLVAGVIVFITWHGSAQDASAVPPQLALEDGTNQRADAPLLPSHTSPAPSAIPQVAEAAEVPISGTPAAEQQPPGEPVTIHGQVVDAAGDPIEGATVWYGPSVVTLVGWGLVTTDMVSTWSLTGSPFDPSSLPHVTTDREGLFTIASRAVTEPLPDPDVQEHAGCGLAVVVTAAGMATRAHGCPGFTSGEYDAGVIELSQPESTVTGRVVQGGEPVQGAMVACVASRVPDAATIPAANCARDMIRYFQRTPTDADGRFRISGLWPGSTSVIVTAPGVGPTGKDKLPIVAGENLDIGDIDVGLRHVVTGIVLDGEGHPVQGAKLYRVNHDTAAPPDDAVYRALVRGHDMVTYDDDPPAPTDSEGRFSVPVHPQLRASIIADAAGFEPGRVTDVGVDTPPLTIILARCSLIVLSVVDADTGVPITEATVHAVRQYNANSGAAFAVVNNVELPVLTGDDARSVLVLGPAVIAPLVIQRAGILATHLAVEAPGYATQGLTVPGLEVGTRRTVEMRLARETVLSGRVVDESGDGIASATVRIWPDDDAPISASTERSMTAADGRFSVHGLGAGTFRIAARAEGFSPSDELVVAVIADGHIPPIDFVLSAAGAIDGVVYDSKGDLARGRKVRVTGEERERQPRNKHILTTDTQGAFKVESLRPGPYSIEVDSGSELSVQVDSGRTTHVEVRQRVTPTMHGLVLCGGQPVPDAKVTIFEEVEYSPTEIGWVPFSFMECGADGAWTTKLGPDRYRLVAFAPSVGLGAPREVTLDWGQDLAIDLVIAGQRLSGHVLSAVSDDPIEGASVWIKADPDDSGQFSVVLKTDNLGVFRGLLPAGTYMLTASEPHFVSTETGGLFVNGGQDPPALTVRLQPAAVLRGSVRTASSTPAVDGTVVVVELPGKSISSWPQAKVTGGTYRIEGVPAGDLHVMVHRVGWFPYSQPPATPVGDAHVSLVAGEERVMDFVIPDAQ